MTDAEAFLKTIIADPADDGPRLVYAEWLEDHGEHERCEFIRTQIELAAWKGKDHEHCPTCGLHWRFGTHNLEGRGQDYWCNADHKWTDGDHERLRRRERALLLNNWSKWYPSIPGVIAGCVGITRAPDSLNVVWHTFARGFVSAVSAPLAVLLGGQECERCHGAGEIGTLDGTMGCVACGGSLRKRGTGRTPGILPALAALVPLEKVTASDREPDMHPSDGRENAWWNTNGPETPYQIPPEVFALLQGFSHRWLGDSRGPDGQDGKCYPTSAAARDALSAALVRHGRGLVPWLNPPVPISGSDGANYSSAKLASG